MTGRGNPRHTEATRQAILQAGVELLLERRRDGFSVQEVATRAGVTHRTVYRYFATRQELVLATARSLVPDVTDDPFEGISTVEQWIEAVGPHFERIEANLEIVRSILSAVLVSDELVLFDRSMRDRDAHRWRVLRRQFPQLTEAEARQTFFTLRHLTSSDSYVLLRLRFALSPAEAAETLRSAARAILERTARTTSAGTRDDETV